MPIFLRIENVDSLADGGALEFRTDRRSFDIGRDPHLDWTLPDPDRVISGRHCQIVFRDEAYWLTDVSRNGTYLNNSGTRMPGAHRLAAGDRLQIGRYLIRVEISGAPDPGFAPPTSGSGSEMPLPPMPAGGDIWGSPSPAPSPVNREWFSRDAAPPAEPQVLSQFVELPNSGAAGRPLAAPPLDNIASNYLKSVPGAEFPGAHAMPGAALPPPPAGRGGAEAFIATMAVAAGLDPATLAARNQQELAQDIGQTLAVTAEHLSTLLRFRAAAKRMTRSAERTQVSAAGNNPLKFVPGHREALEIMYGPPRPGYLSGPASVAEALKNMTAHEMATYAAMQKALARLIEDLAPEAIEDELKGAGFGSKKTRAWDLYVTRWRAKEDRSDNGMLDAFLKYFAQAYDEASKP